MGGAGIGVGGQRREVKGDSGGSTFHWQANRCGKKSHTLGFAHRGQEVPNWLLNRRRAPGCRHGMECISPSMVSEPWAQGVRVRREVAWGPAGGSNTCRLFAQPGHGTYLIGYWLVPQARVSLLYHMATVKASVCCAPLTRQHLPDAKESSVPPPEPERDLLPSTAP